MTHVPKDYVRFFFYLAVLRALFQRVYCFPAWILCTEVTTCVLAVFVFGRVPFLSEGPCRELLQGRDLTRTAVKNFL